MEYQIRKSDSLSPCRCELCHLWVVRMLLYVGYDAELAEVVKMSFRRDTTRV